MKTKLLNILSVIVISLITIACGNSKTTKAPSIKENSNHFANNQEKEDYSVIPAQKLHKQIKAHYNLDEFDKAKDKITYLITTEYYNNDSVRATNINSLNERINVALKKIELKKQKVYELEQNKRLSTSLNKMNLEKQGATTIYKDLDTPKFETKECFYAYVKQTKNSIKLYFKVRYIDPQPLNIQDYIINVDKLDYTINGDVLKSFTKGKKKYCVELLDKEITTKEDLTSLKAIANGNEVTAIYVGENTYKKREISETQKQSLRNVIDAYTFLITKSNIK